MFDDLISSLGLVAKKCGVITAVVKGFLCTSQGRINEICEQEASGKTNVALHIIKEAQIKSAEICSRMQDQAISHCLMMLCHGSSSCYLFVLAVAALLQCELDHMICGTFQDLQSRN